MPIEAQSKKGRSILLRSRHAPSGASPTSRILPGGRAARPGGFGGASRFAGECPASAPWRRMLRWPLWRFRTALTLRVIVPPTPRFSVWPMPPGASCRCSGVQRVTQGSALPAPRKWRMFARRHDPVNALSLGAIDLVHGELGISASWPCPGRATCCGPDRGTEGHHRFEPGCAPWLEGADAPPYRSEHMRWASVGSSELASFSRTSGFGYFRGK